MEPRQLLADVVRLVEAAGERLRAEWQRPGGPQGQGDKARVDDEIEAFLREGLLALLEADFWGEETGQAQGGHACCWVVDPHDGTRDFLLGLPGSSVSVGLLRDGVPVLGVVHAPFSPDRGSDCLAWAEGLPHLLRNGRPHGVDLSARQLTEDSIVWLNAAALHRPQANLALCRPARFVASPSVAYRLARAAAGDGDCAVSLTTLAAHDVAGAHALLIGAGGVLLDQDGQPLVYDDMARVSRHCFGGAPAACALLARRPWAEAGAVAEPARLPPAAPVFPRLDRLRRAYGCLAGLLIGDNLAAQVDFQTPEAIARRCAERPLQMERGGHWNLLAGQPTDDGEMALALARSLLAAGGYQPEVAAQAYVDWLQSAPFELGRTIATALSGPFHGQGLPLAEACQRSALQSSEANGALMRVAPIGIAACGNPSLAVRWARQDARLTHPNPVCQAANGAFAAALAVGVDGGSRAQMLKAAVSLLEPGDAGRVVTEWLLAGAAGQRPSDYQQRMGWVQVALQNAFYHLMAGHGAEQAIFETARQGGDADTNAAVVGALIGATEGVAGFASWHLLAVASCRADAQAPRPRPPTYWPDDAALLAQRLLGLVPPA